MALLQVNEPMIRSSRETRKNSYLRFIEAISVSATRATSHEAVFRCYLLSIAWHTGQQPVVRTNPFSQFSTGKQNVLSQTSFVNKTRITSDALTPCEVDTTSQQSIQVPRAKTRAAMERIASAGVPSQSEYGLTRTRTNEAQTSRNCPLQRC